MAKDDRASVKAARIAAVSAVLAALVGGSSLLVSAWLSSRSAHKPEPAVSTVDKKSAATQEEKTTSGESQLPAQEGKTTSGGQPAPATTVDQSLSPTIQPVTSVMAAKSPGLGTLDVQVTLGGCNYLAFEIRTDDRVTGSGRVGEKMQVSAGTHMLVIKSRFGKEPAKQVVIQRGQLTAVDFTPELGKLRVNGYPQIGAPSYRVDSNSANWLASDYDQCGPAGIYEVSFGFTVLFPPDIEIRFPVEVKAGETTIVEPVSWPYQLGQVLFSPAKSIGEVQIQDTQKNIQFTRSLNYSSTAYWMLTGTYRMTLLKQPYTGTEYQFEIKAGKKIILHDSGRPIPKP